MAFISGWGDYNASNDAADQIIESPDRFLLSQEEVFEAEGGYGTFGMTMGLAAAGGAAGGAALTATTVASSSES